MCSVFLWDVQLLYGPLLGALVGGMLSIVGGFMAQIIRARVDKKQHIGYIKIGLGDELSEICDIIKGLKDSHTKSKVVYQIDLDALEANTESFELHKKSLFLINNQSLRKRITDFYKSLRAHIAECRTIVASIDPGGNATTEFNAIVAEFVALSQTGNILRNDISCHEYKIWKLRKNK